jgi:hypothetical protein
MADDLIHPDDRPDPAARFRADLAGYLHGLPAPELADLLDGLPDPVTVDLIAALAARGPASARLPDTWPGHPDSEFMRRRSLREVVANRRAARAADRGEDAERRWPSMTRAARTSPSRPRRAGGTGPADPQVV